MTHPKGAPNVDGKCCACGITREELEAEKKPEPSTKSDFLHCQCTHFQMNHRPFTKGGCRNCACETFRLGEQKPEREPEFRCEGCGHTEGEGCGCPPLTLEEEEEAPEDEEGLSGPCDCGEGAVHYTAADCPANEMDRRWAKAMGDEEPEGEGHFCVHPEGYEGECPCPPSCSCCKALPPSEGPEYTPCMCGHIEPDHEPDQGGCNAYNCDCSAYCTCEHPNRYSPGRRTQGGSWLYCPDCEAKWYDTSPMEPPPPQPGRRPPVAVAYSVQGHLYEVALPGDASVRAVDGALVIQHHLGPVAGIVSVLPVINEESSGSA